MTERPESDVERMDRLYPEAMAKARAEVKAEAEAEAQARYDADPEPQKLLHRAMTSPRVRRPRRSPRTVEKEDDMPK